MAKRCERILSRPVWSCDVGQSGNTAEGLEPPDARLQMYLMAAERLEIDPTKMLVLEDSGNGCAAAVVAKAYTVAIPSEHTREQPFSGARLVANSLLDERLWALIGK